MKRKSNKLVAGVGNNNADYPVVKFENDNNGKRNRVWICPYYRAWAAMLNRCYRKNNDKTYNAYRDTTVSTEWLTFSNFKSWMETQDWEGKELDKDLLTDNNQYSEDNCIFIPEKVNSYITGEKSKPDFGLVGVYEKDGVYYVSPSRNLKQSVSSFTNARDAVICYRKSKIEGIKNLHATEDVEKLLILFFNRLYEKQIAIVIENPDKFPPRLSEIRRMNVPKIGDRFKTSKGLYCTVIAYVDAKNVLIEFDNGGIKKVSSGQLKTGQIKWIPPNKTNRKKLQNFHKG